MQQTVGEGGQQSTQEHEKSPDENNPAMSKSYGKCIGDRACVDWETMIEVNEHIHEIVRRNFIIIWGMVESMYRQDE